VNSSELIDHIQKTLTEELKKFITKTNSTDTKKEIANTTEGVLYGCVKSNNITSFKVGNATTLWKSMSFIEKTEWFLLNRIFRFYGDLLRLRIELRYELNCMHWQRENPKSETEDAPFKLEYPPLIEPSPKSIIIMSIAIKPVVSANYINITLDPKKEGLPGWTSQESSKIPQ
jgi:hypothetical protein